MAAALIVLVVGELAVKIFGTPAWLFHSIHKGQEYLQGSRQEPCRYFSTPQTTTDSQDRDGN